MRLNPGGGVVLASTKLQPEGVQGLVTVVGGRRGGLPDALPHPMNQWISAILHDTPLTITVEDGWNVTQILEGAYTAAREKREVVF